VPPTRWTPVSLRFGPIQSRSLPADSLPGLDGVKARPRVLCAAKGRSATRRVSVLRSLVRGYVSREGSNGDLRRPPSGSTRVVCFRVSMPMILTREARPTDR
jgi:hypothetical protein